MRRKLVVKNRIKTPGGGQQKVVLMRGLKLLFLASLDIYGWESVRGENMRTKPKYRYNNNIDSVGREYHRRKRTYLQGEREKIPHTKIVLSKGGGDRG